MTDVRAPSLPRGISSGNVQRQNICCCQSLLTDRWTSSWMINIETFRLTDAWRVRCDRSRRLQLKGLDYFVTLKMSERLQPHTTSMLCYEETKRFYLDINILTLIPLVGRFFKLTETILFIMKCSDILTWWFCHRSIWNFRFVSFSLLQFSLPALKRSFLLPNTSETQDTDG